MCVRCSSDCSVSHPAGGNTNAAVISQEQVKYQTWLTLYTKSMGIDADSHLVVPGNGHDLCELKIFVSKTCVWGRDLLCVEG